MSKLIRTGSLFVDSGAHGLYNLHVLQHKKKLGKHGKPLERPQVKWSQGDFSYYDLSKGSEFREYCEGYAEFIKDVRSKPGGKKVIMANVDAISNPALTWEIQRFFEEELGVQPVPIIHCHTPMEWVDKYLEAGRYGLLGVGGLGQGISRHEYFGWADRFFLHICPESNNRLPLIRTHGFAMTSWELICEYPWWSVDSATWVKLAAYGWLYVPPSNGEGFRFDRPPYMVNFSERPAKEKGEKKADYDKLFGEERTSPRKKEKNKHYANVTPEVREACDRWLEHLDLPMGSIDSEGEILEEGVTSHHRPRAIANLNYLKDLEESRPKWPHPVPDSVIERHNAEYAKGFGL